MGNNQMVCMARDRAFVLNASAAWGVCDDAQLLLAMADRIEELEREVEKRTYDGIHTCHDQCQRVACVQRRRIEELEATLQRERAMGTLLAIDGELYGTP